MCVNSCFEKTLQYSSPGHGGWGIIRIAALIPESHQMFICPSACFRHGALGAIQHGYKDRTSYLYITPADIVTGYDEVILEGTRELLEKDKTIKVLFLFVPCMDDFIGTDIDSIAKAVEAEYPNTIVRVGHMNPIAADTTRPPLVTTMQAMYSTIVTKDYATENAVNLFGSFARIEETCELFDFLGDYGIQVRQMANYTKYEEFCEQGRSKYNLIMRPAGKFAAEYMDKNFGTISASYMISYDVDEIRRNYTEWNTFLSSRHEKCTEATFHLEKIEAETKMVIETTKKLLNGIPIIVSDSAVLCPFSLAVALIKYGFVVKEIIAQEVLPVDKEAYQFICTTYPEITITQPRHHKSAVRKNEDTYALAIGFEGAYLRQSDYVVDLSGDEGMYGYYGVKRLMQMMEQAIVKKADLRKMIEEYGAVV